MGSVLYICLVIFLQILYNSNAAEISRVGSEDLSYLHATNLAHSFFNHVNSKILVDVTDSQNDCSTQQFELLNALKRNKLWALKMLDAWGKIPSGLLYEHFMEMGNFDECLQVTAKLQSGKQLQGKYCLSNIPWRWAMGVQNVQIGMCIPAACSAQDFDIMLKQYMQDAFNITVNETVNLLSEPNCVVNEPVQLKALDWVTIAILILLLIFLLLSTCYDYLRTHSGKALHPLLVAFSIRKNFKQLLQIQHTQIPCLHGIRSLSLVWIVFIHCYMFLLLSPNINAVVVNDWYHTPYSMFQQSGTVAVDTFFFLSGLLLVMVKWKDMKKQDGKLNVLIMYAHRYLRLTPVLAMTVLYFMSLYRYMGNGPIWNSFISSYKFCDETWWATLLYIQNYAAPGKMCLGHSWYLAVDMQLYFISPIILFIIWKWKKLGLAAIVVFGLLLVACLFSIVMLNGFSFIKIARNNGAIAEIMPKVYYSTHTRTSPWLVGIIFGYFLHCRNGKVAQLSKFTVLMGWLISIALLLTVIFAWYPKTLANATEFSPLESAFYLSLSRVAWPLALCWLVYACMNGYGGPVNAFLSWPLWQLLAKLSFSMYILHLLVVTANAARTKTNTYFSDYDAILLFWGNFGTTILLSVCMYLAVEAPAANLEKHLLPHTKPIPKTDMATTTASNNNLCD